MSALLRDAFNPETIKELTARVKSAYPALDTDSFYQEATARLTELDFGERLEQVTDTLHNHLPKDFEQTVEILLNSLPPLPSKRWRISNLRSGTLLIYPIADIYQSLVWTILSSQSKLSKR